MVSQDKLELFLENIVSGHAEYKRHMSVPDDTKPTPDGSVLKKVASLNLNKAELESKITKPRFVPEKLDFQLYEKFEGTQFLELDFLYLKIGFLSP